VTSAIHLGSDSKVFVGVIVIAVIVAVHLIFQINGDGANRLEGVQPLSVYLILGISGVGRTWASNECSLCAVAIAFSPMAQAEDEPQNRRIFAESDCTLMPRVSRAGVE
jgi:hypothetical protein